MTDLAEHVTDPAVELSRRRRLLENITSYDIVQMQSDWLVLADDFEAIGYYLNADKCREKADRLRLRR